jgi:hypothetical protein
MDGLELDGLRLGSRDDRPGARPRYRRLHRDACRLQWTNAEHSGIQRIAGRERRRKHFGGDLGRGFIGRFAGCVMVQFDGLRRERIRAAGRAVRRGTELRAPRPARAVRGPRQWVAMLMRQWHLGLSHRVSGDGGVPTRCGHGCRAGLGEFRRRLARTWPRLSGIAGRELFGLPGRDPLSGPVHGLRFLRIGPLHLCVLVLLLHFGHLELPPTCSGRRAVPERCWHLHRFCLQ